jgi:molecular chaperone GrpE
MLITYLCKPYFLKYMNQEKTLADKDKSKGEKNGKTTEASKASEAVDAAGTTAAEKEACDKKEKSQAPDIEALQAQLAAEKDRSLRLSAEFENYKKRSSRELADFKRYANEAVFNKLLTVVDNLERAIASGEQDDAGKAIVEGVQMTHKELLRIFETFSIKRLEAEGTPFDPSFHQAVTHQESNAHPDNTVITELQKGYMIHDRLLRPAMVVVSKATEKAETAQETVTESNAPPTAEE